MAKLIPLLTLPLFWRDASSGSRWLEWKTRLPLLWFPVGSVLTLLVFVDAGQDILSGLRIFFAKWRFNDALFSLFYGYLKDPGLNPDDAALLEAKQICGGLLVGIIAWVFLRQRDPIRAAATIIGANLLLSPVLHPWYLLWVLPFQVISPAPAWIFLSGAAFVSYNAMAVHSATGIWLEQAWVKWAQFGPFFVLLLAYPVYRRLRHRP